MPELVSNQIHDNDRPLRLILNLTGVEHPEAWEGWLVYDISLIAGDDAIAACTQRMMENKEIIRLCEILEGSTQAEFEPMEPDFHLIYRPTKLSGRLESYEAFVFINEAIRRKEGYYSRDGVGLKLALDKSAGRKFATQLRNQHAKLTAGLQSKL